MDRVEEPNVSSSSAEIKARTLAYANFDSNTNKLLHLISFINTGASGFRTELDTKLAPEVLRIAKEIAQISKPQDKEGNAEESRNSAERDALVQKLSDTLVKPFQQFTDGFLTAREWIPVLLVTTAEAYLEDVLTYAAKTDPSIMESRAKVPYVSVVKAQSLENLKNELKETVPPQWARNFLKDGGPTAWIKKLTKMGARGYRPEAAKELETLRAVRHLLVHSSGVATAEFVRRHPEIGAKIGDNIVIRNFQLTAWIKVVYHLVELTDSYFVQRYGARTAPKPPERK